MPFTLAHPAAVLPLRRTRLVFSALVVGALAPDFPYFFLMNERAGIGHSVEGVFRFCLPVGLAVLLVYHLVVKIPLVALAPAYVRDRMSPQDLAFRFGPWSRFLLIAASLLVGAFTHVLWDGFTHDHGYFVKLWPLLRERDMWGNRPIFKLLQFGCSALGMALLAWAAWRHWRSKTLSATPIPSDISLRWRVLVLVGISCVGIVVGLKSGYEYYHFTHQWKWSTVETVIHAIVGLNVAILVYSFFWHARQKFKNKKLPGRSAQELELASKR